LAEPIALSSVERREFMKVPVFEVGGKFYNLKMSEESGTNIVTNRWLHN
jgi:hypothetical protein